MQEDPYAGHRFHPHDYGGGGGSYRDNYGGNTSFDRNSEQSYHSDRNRMVWRRGNEKDEMRGDICCCVGQVALHMQSKWSCSVCGQTHALTWLDN